MVLGLLNKMLKRFYLYEYKNQLKTNFLYKNVALNFKFTDYVYCRYISSMFFIFHDYKPVTNQNYLLSN